MINLIKGASLLLLWTQPERTALWRLSVACSRPWRNVGRMYSTCILYSSRTSYMHYHECACCQHVFVMEYFCLSQQTKSLTILKNITRSSVALLWASRGQFREDNMSDTLLVLLYLWVTNLAALRWILSRVCWWDFAWGFHAGDEYSNIGLTSVL